MKESIQFSQLLLTARLAVALHCFQRFCHVVELESTIIEDFLNYFWDFPIISGPEEFVQWQRSEPELVNVGFGEALPPDFEYSLFSHNVIAQEFRNLVGSVAEIIGCSFYAAANNQISLENLERVLKIVGHRGATAPAPQNFVNSLFADRQGWGKMLSPTERDKWRYLDYSVSG